MYQVSRILISKQKYPQVHRYLAEQSHLAKNLHNAALFRVRQHFLAQGKDSLTENEKEVEQEVDLLLAMGKKVHPVLSYTQLERLMRLTENPDFFSGLPMQTAQQVLKQTVKDFKNWLAALRKYQKDPSSFSGKPNMPGYRKGEWDTFTITNQDAILYESEQGTVLKLPKTKLRIPVSHLSEQARLKEVKVKPFYDSFELLLTLEVKTIHVTPGDSYCAIDFGVTNLAALVTNTGKSVIYKGGAVKAVNQWFHKERARLTSILETQNGPKSSRRLLALSKHRTLFLRDYLHKVSHHIIAFCREQQIGTLIIGENKGWKQRVNIGYRNNQAFVGIPFDVLKSYLTYKAELAGITVLVQDETNTSQADFLAGNSCDPETPFTGKRIKRGLYRSQNGAVVHADLNAAANIMRKAVGSEIAYPTEPDFLKNPDIMRFHDLYR